MGMEAPNFQKHVRTKNFEARYAAEFSETAEGVRRMVLVDMLTDLPEVKKHLLDIIRCTDPDQVPASARVKAIETFLKFLPPLPDLQERDVMFIEVRNPVDAEFTTKPSDEDMVRTMIEANVLDAAESRGKRK